MAAGWMFTTIMPCLTVAFYLHLSFIPFSQCVHNILQTPSVLSDNSPLSLYSSHILSLIIITVKQSLSFCISLLTRQDTSESKADVLFLTACTCMDGELSNKSLFSLAFLINIVKLFGKQVEDCCEQEQ